MAITILPPYDSDEDNDQSAGGDSPRSYSSQRQDEGSDSDSSSPPSRRHPRPYKRAKVDDDGDGALSRKGPRILVPGEMITREPQWMRGHGTYSQPSSSSSGGAITASLPGPLQQTNKLLSITALRSRYTPSIGDLVIGRISSVDRNRWRVEIAAPLLAHLPLSSINLPGGVLRRRTTADELQMRNYFQEGDLVVAEVQGIGNADGVATLHTRSLRYGKLRNGVFVAVAGGMSGVGVVRSKRQVFVVPTANTSTGGGAVGIDDEIEVTLGVNGYIWLSRRVLDREHQNTTTPTTTTTTKTTPGATTPSISNLDEIVSTAIYSSQNDFVAPNTRREIARLGSCIVLLADAAVRVDEETVVKAYRAAVEAEMERIMDAEMEMDVDVDVDVDMDGGDGDGEEEVGHDARRKKRRGMGSGASNSSRRKTQSGSGSGLVLGVDRRRILQAVM